MYAEWMKNYDLNLTKEEIDEYEKKKRGKEMPPKEARKLAEELKKEKEEQKRTIIIDLEEYKELLIIKGKYEEFKSNNLLYQTKEIAFGKKDYTLTNENGGIRYDQLR